MRSTVEINSDDVVASICKDLFMKNGESINLSVRDLERLKGVDINELIASGRHSGFKAAVSAASNLSGVIYGNFASSEGTNFAAGEISKEAIESINILKHIEIMDPERYKDGTITIDVVVTEDGLWRPSVAPEKYDGIDNILELLNRGYTARKSIKGMWHGRKIKTLRKRAGAWFFDGVIDEYFKLFGDVDTDVIEVQKI